MVSIVALGSANVDFTATVEALPKKGSEVLVYELYRSPGGSASNFAVGIKRLGLPSGIIAKVGNDQLGKFLIKDFRKEGVDISCVKVEKGIQTGTVFIAVTKDGERSMFSFRGANAKISVNDLDPKYIAQAKILHVTGTLIEVAEAAMRCAKKAGVLVSFDPGSVLASMGLNYLKKALMKTDLFLPNEAELKKITNLPTIDKAANALFKFGIKYIVVKRGKLGCRVYTEEEKIDVPAFKVKVIDATGAGDAFSAGFIFGHLKNFNLEKAAELGNAAAAFCIARKGARALPSQKQLEVFLNTH